MDRFSNLKKKPKKKTGLKTTPYTTDVSSKEKLHHHTLGYQDNIPAPAGGPGRNLVEII